MILGLDVGGTHTDTALISPGGVARVVKTPTTSDLMQTLTFALSRTLETIPLVNLERMVFSTTLATNAVVQDQLRDVGMMVFAGPGLDPAAFSVGPSYHVIPGVVDHRGVEVVPPDEKAVERARLEITSKGIDHLGIVGKFSVRHPKHELLVHSWVRDHFKYISLGHTVSGALNFPRRIQTTYLNAAISDIHVRFVEALRATLDCLGLTAPSFLLKPEGGAVLMERTLDHPAHTAQSGPAASVVGAMALCGANHTALVLDIGGTTTDMALLLDGRPLMNPNGIQLGPYKTLIPSLCTKSIGAGGDSQVRIDENGALKVGPNRLGPPAAMGGPAPTPTDAFIVLESMAAGKPHLACEAMKSLARPLCSDPRSIAEAVIQRTACHIAEKAREFIEEINSQPVYTIHEVIQGRYVQPEKIIVIGGPAPNFAPYLERALGLPTIVPRYYKAANAVGAACARVTSELTLHADTALGVVLIPEEDFQQGIPPTFTIEEARALALDKLRERALREGADPEGLKTRITEEGAYNMVRGFHKVGKNIRLKAQVTPGLYRRYSF
ncbi:MAG: hydantoinase/oxoprolinase family protein [Deltaproteobacteria bacterium]|nr:hydantoinase/oxoprolinase family protein [Deltaproteobacteria bacterium]